MTLAQLELNIANSVSQAEQHSNYCTSLVSQNKLVEVINYCNSLKIKAPQCSLTAQSPNATRLREKAAQLLSDKKWWAKQLENKAIQDFEATEIAAGHVTNFISDALYQYTQKQKKIRN